MITPITLPKEINSTNTKNSKRESFKGLGEVFTTAVTSGLQMCDTYPMVGVSVIDAVSAIIPRTAVDLKTAGPPAALETARRESSGLIVNCLTPSLFVLGVAALLNKPFMKDFKGVNMAGSWANQNSIEKFVSIYKNADPQDKVRSFVFKTLEGLEACDGKEWVDYATKLGKGTENGTFDKVVTSLTEIINNPNLSKKETKKAIQKVYSMIAEAVKATESIRFKDDLAQVLKEGKHEKEAIFSSNLLDLLRDKVHLGRIFRNIDMTETAKDSAVDITKKLASFSNSATKMVNAKSLIGLAIILPLAMSMQYINRALTRKQFNQKGAPIYKDFGKGNTNKEMTADEKHSFFLKKVAAASTMFVLAAVSMMKKPTFKMLQFKGMFPSLDQCRWIAASTFASRLLAAEDKNELRESLVRDVVTFSGLYFLGDYVAKGVATLIEKISKSNVKLLNRVKVLADGAPIYKRLGNWIKNVKVKSFDEVAVKDKKLRALCQAANIGFSLLLLGVFMPLYNRRITEKKVKQQKEREALATQSQNATNVVEFSAQSSNVFNKFLASK